MSDDTKGIRFFGSNDYNKAGRIASEIPSWAMESHIDDLREGIESKRRAIARGDMPYDAIPQAKAEIEREEKQLQSILDGRPKLTAQETDKVARVYKDLSEKISESMFTRDEMMKGFANPQEEAKRMVKPVIKIDKETAEICEANGIRVEKVKNSLMVSRNGASKMYKLIGRYLGEHSNTEYLRRQGGSYSTETINR
jgi:hypothetical protein